MATDNSGNSEGTYNSLAFGDGLAISGADNDAYHFAGLDYDFSTASDHAQFRQYNPTSGQWLSPDMFSGSYDFSNPQSLNRYSYVLNNPLSLTDPEGLDFGCGLLCWMPLPPVPPPCCGGGGGGTSPHYIITVVGLRPNGSPWDEYHIHYGADIADALGLPDAGCDFGACGAGPSAFSGGGGDPTSQIQSLYRNILEHLEKIAANPEDQQAVGHWTSEVQNWTKQILNKAAKRLGDLNKYLQRIIGITGSDLKNLLPTPFIIVDPCGSAARQSPYFNPTLCGPPIG